VIEYVTSRLVDDFFAADHKRRPQDFTRERALPFPTMMIMLMNFFRRSIQSETDAFFKALKEAGAPAASVTAASFCDARKKLRHTAFVQLNRECVDKFYAEAKSPAFWKQRWRLLAIDGTTLGLPASPSVLQEFPTPASAGNFPLARMTICHDVLNGLHIDTALGTYTTGEREVALGHLPVLKANDLVLIDRGFAAHWFFAAIQSRKADFIARIPTGVWSATTAPFLESGKKAAIIEIAPSVNSAAEYARLGIANPRPMKVRLVRFDLPSGEEEVLATSVLDSRLLPADDIIALYADRWVVEENFKWIKIPADLENFTGKSAENVRQDIFARLFMLNLATMLIRPSQEKVEEDTKERKLHYQINMTYALGVLKAHVPTLFMIPNAVRRLVGTVEKLFMRALHAIRPGRYFPRQVKCPGRKCHMNYKPM